MQIQYWFELFGTAVFAISGALSATEKFNSDWFGAIFIGFITALGGGSLRDVLLGSYPVAWIKDVNLIYVVFIAIILTRLFYSSIKKMKKLFFLFDTMGIALFTVVGTTKAMSLGVGAINAAMMGMFTAVFGGVIRDILINEIPTIFQKEIYATACLAGAALYLILNYFSVDVSLNQIISCGLIFVIRILAVKFDWHLPRFIK